MTKIPCLKQGIFILQFYTPDAGFLPEGFMPFLGGTSSSQMLDVMPVSKHDRRMTAFCYGERKGGRERLG